MAERSFDIDVPGAPRARVASASHVVWKRRIAKSARWLHIYGSMVSLAVVLFFSATGILLNHPQWFAGQVRTVERSGAMATAWTAGETDAVARLEIVEFLRSNQGIAGAVGDFRVDEREVSIAFRRPGYTADVFVDRETGRYTLSETRQGLAAVLNDLHKGRDSGGAWKFVIDVSAGLLCFVSLSGLVLLYFLQKHRAAGVLLTLIGGLATYLVYVAAVP